MSARISWRLLIAEYLLAINAAQAIMPLFCLSIGLTQGEIGFKEVICSVVYLIFNIPTGWLADRISRKACNFIGDAFYGVALVTLGLSTSFMGATIAGIVMALGNACSQGADDALFKAHCDNLGKDYVDTRKRLQQTSSWVALGYYLVGGILTSLYSMKATILVASIPFFVAAVVSCFIKELGTHKEIVEDQPSSLGPEAPNDQLLSLKARFSREREELWQALRFVLQKRQKLSWLLFASAVATVMGGPIMGLVGPIIIAAGGSEGLVGASHVGISLASICGGWLSRKAFQKWKPLRLFMVMSSISLLTMFVTSLFFSPWTAGIHIILVQIVRSYLMNCLRPLVYQEAPDDIQATVGSLLNSISQALYIVVVFAVYFAANHGVQWGIATNALIFTPLVAVVAWRHRKISKDS